MTDEEIPLKEVLLKAFEDHQKTHHTSDLEGGHILKLIKGVVREFIPDNIMVMRVTDDSK
jgi:hypothetical protein